MKTILAVLALCAFAPGALAAAPECRAIENTMARLSYLPRLLSDKDANSASGARLSGRWPGLLAQQGADLHRGIIDLDLKIWISRLQLPSGGFGRLGRIERRLEMAVDHRREPFGRWPVGA